MIYSHILPLVRQDWKAGHLSKAFVGSFLIAAAAQLCVVQHPVPMTMQVGCVLFLSLTCSPRIAMGAVAFYILEALLGLPVLAGFTGGTAAVFGPRGGYIFGFLALAWVCSSVSGEHPSLARKILAGVAGVAALFLLGVSWLSGFVGMADAFKLGFLPFMAKIPLDIAFGLSTSYMAGKLSKAYLKP